MKTILITGGAGFIGSHVAHWVLERGYRVIVLDNLSRGAQENIPGIQFIKGDSGSLYQLHQIFKQFQIDLVMHFAAYIDVGESMRSPEIYYRNNVAKTIVLLDAMLQYHIKKFIFSSSAAIFGLPKIPKIGEEHPKEPITPYGRTKWMIEQILQDYDRVHDFRSCCLRYFNAAGGDPKGVIKNHKAKDSNIIPIILRSLLEKKGEITLFGTDYPTKDGTCVRDYIHIHDLAQAHILGMERLLAGGNSEQFNLGNQEGYSLREIVLAIEKVTGMQVKVHEGERRAGDPPQLIADASRARAVLGWQPNYPDLETIVSHAWQALELAQPIESLAKLQ